MKKETREDLKQEFKQRMCSFIDHYMDQDVSLLIRKVNGWKIAFAATLCVLILSWIWLL